MYKVLYQPELKERLPNAPKTAFICLAFDGPKGRLRDLLYSISTEPGLQREHVAKFELAALMLNHPPSLSEQKFRLRSIVDVWQKSEAARERQAGRRMSIPHRSDFGADFGRMDIGQNPGWGRD